MEGQSKSSYDVMEETPENKGRDQYEVGKFAVALEGTCNLLLRLLALVLTLAATVVIAADKQTKVVSVKFLDSLPPVDVPVTAKWHYLSAYVYFVVANVIGCAYATLSLLVALARGGGKSKGGLVVVTMTTVLDAVMVALLFSANGAAIAVGVLGLHGNSHVRWNKVCNVFGKFCDQEAASLLISMLGSIAFLLLVVLPGLRLQRTTTL